MESFWETLIDGGLLLLKVFIVLFLVDSAMYYFDYSFSIPFVRQVVIIFFHSLGYTKPI